MFKKKRRNNRNEINAGSMADIAFLLLIFFLVTTTIVTDQGLLVLLPKYVEKPPITQFEKDQVLTVYINAANELMVEKKQMKAAELSQVTKDFVLSRIGNKDKPPIVSLQNDRGTSYETYIIVYNEILTAYNELRNEKARELFEQNYADLEGAKKERIKKEIPMLLSEAELSDHFATAK